MGLMRKLYLLVLVIAFAMSARGQPKAGCPAKCGDLTVQYPFGTKKGCSLNDEFFITCNKSSGEPFLLEDDIKVLEIKLSGELRVKAPTSYACYLDDGDDDRQAWDYLFSREFITVSSQKNKFTALGCDTYGSLEGLSRTNFTTGCITKCKSVEDTRSAEGSSCSGIGCCQTSIPPGVRDFSVTASSFSNHSLVRGFNPCSYAFIVEDGYFNFSTMDLKNLRNVTAFPVIMDWSIGNKTCKQVGKDRVCSENSDCIDSRDGLGYTCKCRHGYKGNPYLRGGCQDIDECARGKHNCVKKEFCHNTDGTFYCRCPKGYHGDATKSCLRREPTWLIALLGAIIGFLLFLLGLCYTFMELKHQKHVKLREKFFEQNGGIMLRHLLLEAGVDMKIFTQKELKQATNNYHESRILGKGGQGTVYKGILPGNREVAIKKAQIVEPSQVKQFINELFVLSQMNHRNVVKLLGCCLEIDIPLLIYEFMVNGALSDHLHRQKHTLSEHLLCEKFQLFHTWETRLKIARETAGTLSYLHFSASYPIIHRDVKSANILLDENFTAKLSDFGISQLIPADQEQLLTLVQGTFGYLDPEYFRTSMLNENSDVYSFGVVLMELLSGQKAVCFDRSKSTRNLVSYFESALEENQLDSVLDKQVANAENQQLEEVAKLAIMCTRAKGEERPTMKEVVFELEVMRMKEKHKRFNLHPGEAESLFGDHIFYEFNCSSSNVSEYNSTKDLAMFQIDSGDDISSSQSDQQTMLSMS